MIAKIFTCTALVVVTSFASVLSGAAAISTQDVSYYDVPKGDGPHDVAPAPDGTVWYTGQRAGVQRASIRVALGYVLDQWECPLGELTRALMEG